MSTTEPKMRSLLTTLAAAMAGEWAKGSDKWDYPLMSRAAKDLIILGPDLVSLGFKPGRNGDKFVKTTNTPAELRKAIFALLKAEGFVYANSGKMMGGSETIHDFIREDMPGVKYQLHIRPYTQWKEKRADMDWTVHTTKMTVAEGKARSRR